MEPGCTLPTRAHPFEQAGHIVAGSVSVTIEQEVHELGTGDNYHVPANVPHGIHAHESATVLIACTPPQPNYFDTVFDQLPIRPCVQADFDAIHEIINDAAQAYKGVIPADCWHDPYMSREELQQQIDQGVIFFGYESDGQLVGVMGGQEVEDVALIRHAYVRTSHRKHGIGSQLLSYLRSLTCRPILIGTWADASWAIRFYEKHGFKLVDRSLVPALLNRYWGVPQRQVETSVVLTDGKLAL
jgi:GNAT superfamily N-acetyltransferase